VPRGNIITIPDGAGGSKIVESATVILPRGKKLTVDGAVKAFQEDVAILVYNGES